MDKDLLIQKYLEQHDGLKDEYLNIIFDICEKFPDFEIDVDFLFRSQVSADFIQYIKNNLYNIEKTHKALEFIKQLYDRPQDEFDAVSEDFSYALKRMIDENKININLLDKQIKYDINEIFTKEGIF